MLEDIIDKDQSLAERISESVARHRDVFVKVSAAVSGLATSLGMFYSDAISPIWDSTLLNYAKLDNPYSVVIGGFSAACIGGALAYASSHPWRQIVRTKRRALDWLSNNKALFATIGGAIGAGYGSLTSAFTSITEGYRFAYPTEIFFDADSYHAHIAHGFLSGFLSLGLSAILLNIAASSRPWRIFGPSDDAYTAHFKGALRRYIDEVKDDIVSRWHLIEFELHDGNTDTVLEEMSEIFSMQQVDERAQKNIQKYIDKSDMRFYDRSLLQIINHHLAGEQALTTLDWQALLSSVDDADKRIKHTFCYANYLDATGRQHLADEQWQDGVDRLLSDSSFMEDLRLSGEGRHKVMSHKDGFIGGYLRFKMSGPEHGKTFQTEYKNLSYFRDVIGERIAEPIRLVDSGMYRFLITRNAGGETLFEHLASCRPTEKVHLIEESIDLLALVHTAGERTDHDLIPQDGDRFFSRRVDGFLSQVDNGQLIRAYGTIDELLCELETTYYKDHNPKNIIVNRYGDIVAIDFESDRLMPPQLDLISALEFSPGVLSKQLIAHAVDRYIEGRTALQPVEIDRGAFQKGYHLCGVQRHIELAGYRKRDQEDMDWIRWHYRMAAAHARELCVESSRYSIYLLTVAEHLDAQS